MVRSRVVVVLVGFGLLIAACQSSTETPSTTAGSSLLTLPPATAPPTSSTTTTLAPAESLSSPQYQIVQRTPAEEGGDTVVVLLDVASYETLTDIDLEDIITDVVQRFPPIATVHVIDDPAAANVVGNPEATEAQIQPISDHYLARLDDGFSITFLGPFAPAGTAVLGS